MVNLEYILNGRTREDNTAIGMEAETSQTKREYEGGIPVTTRRIMSKEHGTQNLDDIDKEIEMPKDQDGELSPEQSDGKNIMTVEYIEQYIDNAINEIMADEDIKEAFISSPSEEEKIKERINNELSNKIYFTNISSKEDLDKIKEDVKWGMSVDAQMYNAHSRNRK